MTHRAKKKNRLVGSEHGHAEQLDFKNHSSPPKRSKRNVPSLGHGLCRTCAKIDLDGVLSRRHKTCGGLPVKKLGPISTWAIGSCPLCSLLATTLAPGSGQQNNGHLTLRSYSSVRSGPMGLNSIDTSIIGLDGAAHRLIHQPQGSTWLRTLNPNSIDFGVIKDWLNICHEMHTNNCASKTSSQVPSMKLIDCETRAIVPAVDHPYVTLSYVYGADLKPFPHCESLPKDLPLTIEDSVSVTQKLGFRYLWIDQFCIDQRHKDDLTSQLLQMDSIYRNSELTIIAAAGRDANHGLPGVSKRPRAEHSYSHIKNQFFVSSLGDPQSVIKESPWMTRAWTYQEGVLSRRRLAFTDEQVYYECYGMRCCEVFDLPLRDMHIKSGQRFKQDFCAGDNIGIFPRGVGRRSWEVLGRIQEYSSKSLTNSSDILNAVLGILKAFEEDPFGIRHCLGIPILTPPSRRSQPSERSQTASWKPVFGFLMGLCWSSDIPTSRRLGFPSWSWTGWTAPVNWNVAELEMLQTDSGIDVEFELDDGRVIDFDSLRDSYDELDGSLALSNHIRISAWTTSIKVLGYEDGGKCTARIELEDGCFLRWDFKPTTNNNLSTDLKYIGIHMGDHDVEQEPFSAWPKTGPALLVVACFESGMERVAFDWVDQRNCLFFEADGTECQDEMLWTNPLYARRPKLVKSWQQIRLR